VAWIDQLPHATANCACTEHLAAVGSVLLATSRGYEP